MRKFFVSILTVSVFFVGLGSMIESVGAKFKSDEKALEIIRAARLAIGGDNAIREVKSLVIVGKTTNSFKFNGFEKSDTGETEIAIQFPDKMMKMVKIGDQSGEAVKGRAITREVTIVSNDGGEIAVTGRDGVFKTSDGKEFNVKLKDNAEFTTEDGKKVIVRSIDKNSAAVSNGESVERVIVRKNADGGETAAKDPEAHVFVRKQGDGGSWTTDGGKNIRIERDMADHHADMKQNELLRTTLGLLLTAPDGMDVSYTFVGEGDVDGTAVNVINASFGGADYKLFIGRSNSLPVAMSFVSLPMQDIVFFNKEIPAPKDSSKDVVMFKRHDEMTGKSAEFMVKFSDFRSTGGVQLPYKWTTTSGGQTTEVFDVTSYDVNPANIAEKFAGQKTMVRMKHPDSN